MAKKTATCREPKCGCRQFGYVPVYGSNDLKCLCKHSYKEHHPLKKNCGRASCKCAQFSSTHSCSCSLHYNAHETKFYSKDQRVAMGKPVGSMGGGADMYAALGGLTDFSSLLDGVDQGEGQDCYAVQGDTRKAIEAGQPQERARREISALKLYNTPHSLAK